MYVYMKVLMLNHDDIVVIESIHVTTDSTGTK